mmetsp:Transcript_6135/g.9061  ORF Transcript_6135/g.9061 Transcript_6135/m.9061 type:complete len:100 (-) Transcript_6135:20-319(-)
MAMYFSKKKTVKDMEPQFKGPRQRFITGLAKFSILSSHKGAELIEELYTWRRGYARVKHEFEETVGDMNAEQEELLSSSSWIGRTQAATPEKSRTFVKT